MSHEEQPSPTSLDALRERFAAQSRKAQAYYTVMHAARQALGSDDAASAWMDAPLGALGGRSPGQAVGEGRHDEALACAAALRR